MEQGVSLRLREVDHCNVCKIDLGPAAPDALCKACGKVQLARFAQWKARPDVGN